MKNLEQVDKNLLKGIFVRRPAAAKMDEVIKKQKSIFQMDVFNRSQSTKSIHHNTSSFLGGGTLSGTRQMLMAQSRFRSKQSH